MLLLFSKTYLENKHFALKTKNIVSENNLEIVNFSGYEAMTMLVYQTVFCEDHHDCNILDLWTFIGQSCATTLFFCWNIFETHLIWYISKTSFKTFPNQHQYKHIIHSKTNIQNQHVSSLCSFSDTWNQTFPPWPPPPDVPPATAREATWPPPPSPWRGGPRDVAPDGKVWRFICRRCSAYEMVIQYVYMFFLVLLCDDCFMLYDI